MHDPRDVLTSVRLELARFPAVLEAMLHDLDSATWRARPAPAEWAPVEIVCHLRDEEVEDFGARVRVILDGGARFAPIDPERWATERHYLDDDGPRALAAFRERRAASLGSLVGIAPARLAAAVAHPRTGQLSGLDLLAAWVAHDRLHLAQLGAALARPGLHVSCLPFLRDHDVSVLVWDMLDHLPIGYDIPWAVHAALFAYGVALLDNALLEPLARACVEEGRDEFMLVIAPLYVVGGTGSPANPLAVF